jgi:hypothetical protein
VFLDGQEFPTGYDPLEPPAEGRVIFRNNINQNECLKIKEFDVQEWDGISPYFDHLPLGDCNQDSITTLDGDRYSGKITGFRSGENGQAFEIKTVHSEATLNIPLSQCTSFSFEKNDVLKEETYQYLLKLRSEDTIKINDFSLVQGKLSASHPWLGSLNLDQTAIGSISKLEPKPTK